MPARKRVNRTDLTLRNLHALKKRIQQLERRITELENSKRLTVSDGPIESMTSCDGRVIVVSGGNVYKITADDKTVPLAK